MFFCLPKLKAQVSFSDQNLSVVIVVVVVVVINFSHFHLLLQNLWAIFNQTWHKHLWVKGIQVCSNEGPHSFPRGDNYKSAKIHCQNFKIFFSRTTRPISNKLGTNYLWVKEFKLVQMKAPTFFQGEII